MLLFIHICQTEIFYRRGPGYNSKALVGTAESKLQNNQRYLCWPNSNI